MHTLRILEGSDALADAAAAHFAARARASIDTHGRFTVALSGGSTPRALYQRLARQPELPWDKIELCFGDERCVPPDHADSNARMVREALTHLPFVPPERVHRILGELAPDEAARAYEASLRKLFPGAELPRFDLVLLGLGKDGHTASLFPHSPALAEKRAWVMANPVPALGATRITLTYPVLQHAAETLFLVSGADKAWALCEVLEGRASIEDVPARGIPRESTTTFLVDTPAASELTPA
ncbi:MAG: 6-phosphogluconolactonase [Polyangiales bacterium]